MASANAAAAAAAPEEGPLVQRTRVVLLAGEEARGPGGALAAPPAPAPAPAPGQLVFVLCRASSLGGPSGSPARLRAALEGLRARLRGCPASALVAVLVQPPAGQEEPALRRLQGLLREAFPAGEEAAAGGHGGPELHAALFAPGRPQGALRVQRLRDQAPQDQAGARALWRDKALLMQVLGAVLSFGTIAYGSYYFYSHPPF